MATIRAFTTIEQGMKLAEILPLESSDMAYYQWKDDSHLMSPVPFVLDGTEVREDGMFTYLNCWSLTALLDVLPYPHIEQNYKGKWTCRVEHGNTTYLWEDSNPVDACVDMVEKLKELGWL